MVVLSRKKNEAILIDGMIRIEVLTVAKATVRVRLTAPRSLQLTRGAERKDQRERQDALSRANPPGMEVCHLTLVNQQVVPIGDSVSLGVVDADRSRVLFFVDAPHGTDLVAADPAALDGDDPPSRQILLQFMGQGAERTDEPHGKSLTSGQTEADHPSGHPAGPDLLPFPSV